MESTTYLKDIKIPPKKLRFFLPEIKKHKPAEALTYLLYAPNRSSRILYQAIHSAINNARNTLKVEDGLLKFKTLTVEEGHKIKRYRPGGRGTAKTFVKRFSHIKIVLVEDVKPTVKKEVKKTVEDKQDKKVVVERKTKEKESVKAPRKRTRSTVTSKNK